MFICSLMRFNSPIHGLNYETVTRCAMAAMPTQIYIRQFCWSPHYHCCNSSVYGCSLWQSLLVIDILEQWCNRLQFLKSAYVVMYSFGQHHYILLTNSVGIVLESDLRRIILVDLHHLWKFHHTSSGQHVLMSPIEQNRHSYRYGLNHRHQNCAYSLE